MISSIKRVMLWFLFKDQPAVRRWIDLTFLAFCSIFLFRIFHRSFSHALHSWLAFTSDWSPIWHFSCATLAAFLVTIILIRCGSIHPSAELTTLFKYPPAWLVSMLCTPICLSIWPSELTLSLLSTYQTVALVLLIIIALNLGIGIGFLCCLNDQVTPSCKNTTSRFTAHNQDQRRQLDAKEIAFLDWIFDERPITTPEQDLYEAKLSAQRIARALLGPHAHNIGLIGPYGTGKSSLLKLVQYYLADRIRLPHAPENHSHLNGKVIVCALDGWGRQPGMIARQLLEVAISEVKKHVDCLSIISLPQNYLTAIGATKHILGSVIAALLNETANPLTQLARLNNILVAANLRLVIFIEDMDRNSNKNILDEELASLLDRLSVLTNVSFVLAISPENRRSDILVRICDLQEAVA